MVIMRVPFQKGADNLCRDETFMNVVPAASGAILLPGKSAAAGSITVEVVEEEIARLRSLRQRPEAVFAVSRLGKSRPNDADRLSKYLARFGLRWDEVRQFAYR